MSAQQLNEALDQLKVDSASLYREEQITDSRAATFRKLTPIKIDGTDDASRPIIFTAQTSIMSPMGVIPLNATLKATTLAEAVAEFPAAIKLALEDMIEEAKEYQRQEASRIVVPDAKTASKIQLA